MSLRGVLTHLFWSVNRFNLSMKDPFFSRFIINYMHKPFYAYRNCLWIQYCIKIVRQCTQYLLYHCWISVMQGLFYKASKSDVLFLLFFLRRQNVFKFFVGVFTIVFKIHAFGWLIYSQIAGNKIYLVCQLTTFSCFSRFRSFFWSSKSSL